jgi:hypothetical protein
MGPADVRERKGAARARRMVREGMVGGLGGEERSSDEENTSIGQRVFYTCPRVSVSYIAKITTASQAKYLPSYRPAYSSSFRECGDFPILLR